MKAQSKTMLSSKGRSSFTHLKASNFLMQVFNVALLKNYGVSFYYLIPISIIQPNYGYPKIDFRIDNRIMDIQKRQNSA